jgi:hypothetical protein
VREGKAAMAKDKKEKKGWTGGRAESSCSRAS